MNFENENTHQASQPKWIGSVFVCVFVCIVYMSEHQTMLSSECQRQIKIQLNYSVCSRRFMITTHRQTNGKRKFKYVFKAYLDNASVVRISCIKGSMHVLCTMCTYFIPYQAPAATSKCVYGSKYLAFHTLIFIAVSVKGQASVCLFHSKLISKMWFSAQFECNHPSSKSIHFAVNIINRLFLC